MLIKKWKGTGDTERPGGTLSQSEAASLKATHHVLPTQDILDKAELWRP